ncbi:hypothetical protein ES708_20791 [subsurface metagenome]
MYFLTRIIDYILDIALFLLDLSHEVRDWGSWARWAADFLVDVADAFARMAYRFEQFNDWVEYVDDLVEDTFSIGQIIKALSTWLDWAEDAWYWVRYAWNNVTAIIDEWWRSILPYLVTMVNDVKSWARTEINNAVENITQVVTNIYDYSRTTINNITEYITEVITNIYDYSRTTINNITEYVTNVYNNVYDYTQTIINNITENVSNFITNINDYTQTTINNITETITQLIDWEKVTLFLNDWRDNFLPDFDSLINSTLQLWFPFYDDLVELWNSIAEFFCDPLDWLKDRIEVWFWGGEE